MACAAALAMASCGGGGGSSLATGDVYVPFKAQSGDRFGMMSTEGKVLFEDEFDNEPSVALGGVFSVMGSDGKLKYYTADAKPQPVGKDDYTQGGYCDGSVIPVVKEGGPVILIDKTGKFVSATRYRSMGVCTSNLFYYGEDGLYGFVDARQNVLTPARYNKIDICREGMVAVAQQGKYGFVNEKGEEVIPCIYSRVNWFDQGFARVARNGRVGYIDKTGREIFLLPSNRFSSASRSGFGVFCFESGGELFIFDEEGNRLDSNGLETPDAASASAGSDASAGSSAAGGSGVVVVPSVSAPASTGSSQSDPVRRVEWEIRRNRAIEELARLQVKLIEDPNSAYIKHNIQTQQNIINTCNEMIAIYQ